MEKTEVIVDTCFLQKLSSEGKKVANIKQVLDELDFIPVVHPYIYQHELSLHSYFENLVNEGYIRLVDYREFQRDTNDQQMYELYFPQLYEDLRKALEAINSPKQMEPLVLRNGQTIYNTHRQGSNMGDVHLMLMASFLRMPIVLTEDSDIDMLRTIAKRRMKLGSYTLQILDGIDLIKQIASKKDSSISSKEIEAILNDMGERSRRSEIKEIRRLSQTN